jgi:hypothetical protein
MPLLWWRPPCLLRAVLVNLIEDKDTALKGVLWQSHGPWLVMRDVAIVRPGLAPTPMDGEVIVHRRNVAFVQVLT